MYAGKRSDKKFNKRFLQYAWLLLIDEKMFKPPHKSFDSFTKAIKSMNERLMIYFPIQCSFIAKVNEQILEKKSVSKRDIDILKHSLEAIYSELDDTFKPTKIFISHSTYDNKIVDNFVDLLSHIGVREENVFCSSVIGYGIPQGSGDIYNSLKTEFQHHNLFVIFMLSQNYYRSPVCLNEMGATWIMQFDYQSILLPNFEFHNVEGVINPRNISFKLDDHVNRNQALNDL